MATRTTTRGGVAPTRHPPPLPSNLTTQFATPPGVEHLRYDAAVFTTLNMDNVVNRVGVVLSHEGCTDRMAQSNDSACSLRFALCYADSALAECALALTYADTWSLGIASVYVDVWLENHFAFSPLDAAHTLATLELRPPPEERGACSVVR